MLPNTNIKLNGSLDVDRLTESIRRKISRPNTANTQVSMARKRLQVRTSSRATTASQSVDISFHDIWTASTFNSSNYIVESTIRHSNSPKKAKRVGAKEGLKRAMERLRLEFLK